MQTQIIKGIEPHSYLVRYLLWRLYLPLPGAPEAEWVRYREQWIETMRRRPHYAWMLPSGGAETREWAKSRYLSGVRKYFPDYTAFALDRFKARADRDGAALVVLMTPGGKDWTHDAFEAMARERGVPVIDMHGYIRRQGGDVRESRFAHDIHWSATGHRWAAEALREWIARNRHVCGAEGGRAIDEPPARG